MTLTECEGGCKRCSLNRAGMKGYLQKIVVSMVNNGVITRKAGEIWLQRGGGVSSNDQKVEDYKKALQLAYQEVCGVIRKNDDGGGRNK